MAEQSTRHLLCVGVPRSGTTFTAALLCSHEHVICGSERFPGPANLTPEAFSEQGFLHTRKDDAHYSKNLHLKDKFPAARVIGDKLPRAYYGLHEILQRFDHLKVIFLVRELSGVCSSWNTRANRLSDSGWSREQVGAFAVLDCLAAFSQLLHVNESCRNDVLLVSYKAIADVSTQASVAKRIFDFLEVDDSANVARFLEREREGTKAIAGKPRAISPNEEALISLVAFDPLIQSLDQRSTATLNEMHGEFSAALSGFHGARAARFWEQLQTTLADYPNPDGCFDYGCSLIANMLGVDSSILQRPVLDTLLSAGHADAFSTFSRCINEESSAAESGMRSVLQQFPKATRPTRRLAQILFENGNVKEAITWLEKALEGEPDDNGLANSLAIALNKDNQPERAVQIARAAIANQPRQIACRFTLAESLLLLRQFDEVEEQLKQIATLKPDHPRIETFSARLLRARARTQGG